MMQRGRVELVKAEAGIGNSVQVHFVLLPECLEIVQTVYSAPPDPQAEQVLQQAWRLLIARLDDWRTDARRNYIDPWDESLGKADWR